MAWEEIIFLKKTTAASAFCNAPPPHPPALLQVHSLPAWKDFEVDRVLVLKNILRSYFALETVDASLRYVQAAKLYLSSQPLHIVNKRTQGKIAKLKREDIVGSALGASASASQPQKQALYHKLHKALIQLQ